MTNNTEYLEEIKSELLNALQRGFEGNNNLVEILRINVEQAKGIANLEKVRAQLENDRDSKITNICTYAVKAGCTYLVCIGTAILLHVFIIVYSRVSLNGNDYGWVLANYALLVLSGVAIVVTSLQISSRICLKE